jgi:hypothetical protein
MEQQKELTNAEKAELKPFKRFIFNTLAVILIAIGLFFIWGALK